MNKAQLIESAAESSGHDRTVMAECLEALQDAIVRAVNKGERVTLTGFVNFTPYRRPARFARNPQTGERVRVKANNHVRIKPGQGFLDVINGERKLPRGVARMKAPKGSVAASRLSGTKVVLASATKPPTAKKATSKRAVKKTTAKKAATRKTAARGTSAKKVASKKTAAKRSTRSSS